MKTIDKNEIRKAVADYMWSEGCSCCEGNDHKEHEKVIADILDVPAYEDRSGYDFTKFKTTENE